MYKNIINGKKAVFFDLDGTIIDSQEYWQEAFNNVASRNGLKGIYSQVIHYGQSTDKSLEIAIDHVEQKPKKTAAQLAEEVSEEYLKIFESAPLLEKDGFWDLVFELKTQKKLPVAIVSNSRRKVVDRVFAAMDIDPTGFDLVITRDDVKHGKPHPEIYKKAAHELKVSPKKVLVFEDSVTGMSSALKAGMDVIVVWSGKINTSQYLPKAKILISDFSELVGKLDHTYTEYVKQRAEQAESGELYNFELPEEPQKDLENIGE